MRPYGPASVAGDELNGMPKDGQIRGFAPGDPRNARIAEKRVTILEAARRHFLQHGFAGTAIEAVASEAGVSKMTLYRHFGTKEALFEALVRDLADLLEMPDGGTGTVEARLRAFGRSFASTLMRPDALAFYRMIVAEAPRFPELAALFQERGRRLAQDWVATVLRQELSLDPEEADRRARGFDALVLGDLYQRCLLDLADVTDEAALNEQVEQAVSYALR